MKTKGIGIKFPANWKNKIDRYIKDVNKDAKSEGETLLCWRVLIMTAINEYLEGEKYE